MRSVSYGYRSVKVLNVKYKLLWNPQPTPDCSVNYGITDGSSSVGPHLSVVCIHQRSYELSTTRACVLYTNDVIRWSKKDPTAWHCVGGSVFFKRNFLSYRHSTIYEALQSLFVKPRSHWQCDEASHGVLFNSTDFLYWNVISYCIRAVFEVFESDLIAIVIHTMGLCLLHSLFTSVFSILSNWTEQWHHLYVALYFCPRFSTIFGGVVTRADYVPLPLRLL